MIFRTRKKLKYLLTPLAIVSIVFIVYQLVIFNKLSAINSKLIVRRILGTHKYHANLYKRSDENKFRCMFSGEKVNYEVINDDYCDCEDGSDEPGTNACPDKTFFCTSQTAYGNYKKIISSNKVNDGICDCCDGSDEYLNRRVNLDVDRELQDQLGRYLSPCPVLCPFEDE